MSFIQEIINGVTKTNVNGSDYSFQYFFPLATIKVTTSASPADTDNINIRYKDTTKQAENFTFGDITDPLSQTTAETYVDELANQGFFFDSPTIVQEKIVDSTLNSTTTPLAGAATFTGTFEKVMTTGIGVSMKTDQAGTLYIDFSPDGTNVDSTLSFNYQTDRIFVPVPLSKVGRYARVRFTNDSATLQTYLRIFTVFEPYTQLTSTLNGTVAENFPASVTRPTDYTEEVAQGKRQGHRTWNKWGFNEDLNSGSAEVVASFGGTYEPPTTAETLDIVSTSVNDVNTTGSGVQQLFIEGIDADRLYQFEIVEMNGTTTVTTASTWLGINRMSAYLCGSGLTNAGDINVINTTSGTTLAQMPEGTSITQQAIFHVQQNHTFLATWLWVNVRKLSGGEGNHQVTVRGYVFSPVANAKMEIYQQKIDTSVENAIEIKPTEPFPITEKSVLWFTAESDTNNTEVAVRFSGKEVRNS